MLACAYALRLSFEAIYDNAETMRRQSVLAEALDWSIEATQFSEWRRKAGRRLLKDFKLRSRDPDYYATRKPLGSGRLLEMTIESAFFTRHIYSKVRNGLWICVAILIMACVAVLSLAPLEGVSGGARVQLVYALYLSLPIVISIDLLGWAIRLGRLSRSIQEIERGLERHEREREPDLQQVLRLVAEYNCQVIGGFPVPNALFRHWHDSINELWESRYRIFRHGASGDRQRDEDVSPARLVFEPDQANDLNRYKV